MQQIVTEFYLQENCIVPVTEKKQMVYPIAEQNTKTIIFFMHYVLKVCGRVGAIGYRQSCSTLVEIFA